MSKTKSKLLPKNTAAVTLKDIVASGGSLSAQFHINKLKGKAPYIFKDNKYKPALPHQVKDSVYLTKIQVKHANGMAISFALRNIPKNLIRK